METREGPAACTVLLSAAPREASYTAQHYFQMDSSLFLTPESRQTDVTRADRPCQVACSSLSPTSLQEGVACFHKGRAWLQITKVRMQVDRFGVQGGLAA